MVASIIIVKAWEAEWSNLAENDYTFELIQLLLCNSYKMHFTATTTTNTVLYV